MVDKDKLGEALRIKKIRAKQNMLFVHERIVSARKLLEDKATNENHKEYLVAFLDDLYKEYYEYGVLREPLYELQKEASNG